MSDLFRVEALDQARPTAYGTILLARPVSHLALTVLFAACALALVAFFASFSVTRKAKVQGVLLPDKGLIRVGPSQAGVLSERRVQEGQIVKAGDVLFVLVSERANRALGNAEASIAALLQRRHDSFVADRDELHVQGRQRTDAARRKSEALAAERGGIDRQVTLQQARVALAENAWKRTVELGAQNFVSAVQVQDKQAEWMDQQQKLADLERARAAVGRDIAALQDEIRDLAVQGRRDREAGERSIGDTERDLAENDARRLVLVRAPQDGTVTAITADLGQSVLANQGLASILPAGSELEAELYAPSRAAGFLHPGTEVMLRYQSYAFQKFGQSRGVVREVSSTAMRPDEMALPGAALTGNAGPEPLYRVRVKLPRQVVTAFGAEFALKAGTAVDASLLLETRRMHEWVLEPLYTIKGQL